MATLLLTAVVGTALAVAGCGDDSASLPEGTVARVGDAPITQAQLDRSVAQTVAAYESQGQTAPAEDSEEFLQVKQQALQTLVQQRIIAAEAAECGARCAVSKADVTKELKSIISSEFDDSQKDFNAFLKERAMTRADARVIVRNSLLQQKLYDNVTRGVRFSAADAKAYYQENKGQFEVPAGRTASHILVDTKAEADAIRARVTAANFAEIAKAESTDTGSASQGGDLGTIQKGQMVEEFEKAAFALKDGEISQPVKTQFGWHIIIAHLTPASTTSFADAKSGIISNQLATKRQEAYSTWAEEAVEDWESRTVYADSSLKPTTDDAATGTTDGAETTDGTE